MATHEAVVDSKPIDLAPVDPNVVVPRHVREAAERAEAVFNAAYQVEQPQEQPPAPVEQPPPPEQAAPPAEQPPAPPSPPVPEGEWEHRYNSMKGRWQATERMMGEMRAQMDQMATELQRSQELLLARTDRSSQVPQSGQPHENLITDAEREVYGDDLINVARKAAAEVLAPEINNIRSENQRLRQEVIRQGQRDLKIALSAEVPNWKEINGHPDFLNWLRLPNVYTGQVRKQVLDAAYQAADAPKVIAIFKDYVKDVVATGGTLPGSQTEQPTLPEQAPHAPVIDPMSIAAPGRARPAGGDTPQTPVDKPIYTRAWISNFYRDVRRGAYRGRETEQARIESDLGRAQYEGRVRG